jgi:hypothetical protein
MSDASYDPVVPFESLGDWVSYSDSVVVATVTGEAPADPTDELGAMGWPNFQSIVIDERVWQHSSAPAPPDSIEFTGGLLAVQPGRRPSLSLVLASVGGQYLVALGRYDDGGWMPVAPMLELVDGRVDPDIAGTYPFADALAGLEVAEIEPILRDVAPHPVAEASRPADPADRFAATIDESSPATTGPPTPATATTATLAPDGDGTSALAGILTDLGVDVSGAPREALGHPDQIVCGGEEIGHDGPADPGWNDTARRCFLDAHLAGLRAAFASSSPTPEGAPIVDVWLTGPAGVTGWQDSTRDPLGSGEWAPRPTCGRLTTTRSVWRSSPSTDFTCAKGHVVEPAARHTERQPQWFTARSPLPLCGYAVRVVDVDERARQCLVDAVNNRARAEFAYATTGAAGERHIRWTRSVGDGTLEIIELQVAADGSGQAWYRFECAGTAFVQEPDHDEYLLARVDASCVLVESAPPDAPAPITTNPDPTPEGCLGAPIVELVSSVDRVEMDIIYYSEQTTTCGYNADGEAMFDGDFRPASAALVPARELAIAAEPKGSVSVDIRPLEPATRLNAIGPSSDVLAAARDGTYPITLPHPGCFVVTVGWIVGDRDGHFTGLAESERGLCPVQ